MTEPADERHLRPAPVLPPPTAPGAYTPPAAAPQGWAPPQQYSYDEYAHYPPTQPGQAPPWGFGGWPPPPPPRKTSVVGRILLGVVGVGAALLFALILLGALVGAGDSTTKSRVDHTPARPDRGGSSQPPQDADALLVANPVYAQGGLANLNCPAEDLGDASTSEQTRFYEKLMGCLNDEWEKPIERAGFNYTDPGLMPFDSPINTPCGNATPEDGRRLAFYCPSDSVMYADVPQMRKFYGDVDVAYATVIGHEFGHHVQFETGVLDAYDEAVYDDYDQRLILSRRIELQASCMAGLFLGAVADTFPIDDQRLDLLERVAGSFGDAPNAPENRRDHGTGESNHDWIMGAFADNDIEFCNTFTAPDSAVN